MSKYPFENIEPKWQKYWELNKTFRAKEDSKIPPEKRKYILDMFPYPSAAGLHVGHPEGYTATDIYCRYLRMKGFNVLHPMGFDSFGLPAENYAIKTGTHPSTTTHANIEKFTQQIKSLGSYLLYLVNQGILPMGEGVDEHLSRLGLTPSDLDAVLITHLDCDHANGLELVKDTKRFLVAADEVRFAKKHRARYYKGWWKDIPLTEFEWNDRLGPVGKSYDLLGDGSVELVNIPGHSDGLFAVKIKNEAGKFVLLFSDGGYARKSWQEMILSGIAADRKKQKESLAWIRAESLDPNCVESLAAHDSDIKPHVIEL